MKTKRSLLLLGCLAALGLVGLQAPLTWGQPADDGEQAGPPPANDFEELDTPPGMGPSMMGPGMGMMGSGGPWGMMGPGMGRGAMFAQRVLALPDLTADQKKSIEDLVEKHHQAMQAWQQQHEGEFKPLHDKMQDLREQAKPALKQLRDSRKEMLDLLAMDTPTSDLVKPLDELRTKFRDARKQLEPLRDQLRDAGQQFRDLHKDAPSARELHKQIMDLLTDEQHLELRQGMMGPGMRPGMMMRDGAPGNPGNPGMGPGMGQGMRGDRPGKSR
ncbi:MAG: hypothetical protein IT442_06865 [Phycisphaeraceae bacterium]|nr:hypothetical protein [Phycisphaeraceae bacterium]